ncbi:MAG: sugar phosphate nucleotidyltransferase, partial [Candidatus Wallbacteria bacterium]|nr:sugar phosphate nucleotidyltransferase [Candidatus Wallbacteria bacterium]
PTNKRLEKSIRSFCKGKEIHIKMVVEGSEMEKQKLGSVGGIKYMVDKLKIKEPLLLFAGDNLLNLNLKKFVNAYKGNLLLAVYDIKDKNKVANKYGNVVLNKAGQIIRFDEKPAKPETSLVSTGCYIFPPEALALLDDFLASKEDGKRKDALGFFCSYLLERKKMTVDSFVFDEPWFDIGGRESYIDANLYYSKKDNYTGKNVKIENSKVKKSVILNDVTITDCELEGCAVAEGAELTGVKLKNCLVGAGSKIKEIL